MPLESGKSKGAFVHNIKAERSAGKPMKQSLAIAYNMKRKAKKMADGGTVAMTKEEREDANTGAAPTDYGPNEQYDDESGKPMPNSQLVHQWYGSRAALPGEKMSFGGDVVDKAMRKRYSEGGEVANDTPAMADSLPNDFDDLSLRDDLTSTYGEDDNAGDSLDNTQENSDREDIIARIMRSRAKKDRLPRPA